MVQQIKKSTESLNILKLIIHQILYLYVWLRLMTRKVNYVCKTNLPWDRKTSIPTLSEKKLKLAKLNRTNTGKASH